MTQPIPKYEVGSKIYHLGVEVGHLKDRRFAENIRCRDETGIVNYTGWAYLVVRTDDGDVQWVTELVLSGAGHPIVLEKSSEQTA